VDESYLMRLEKGEKQKTIALGRAHRYSSKRV